MEQPPFRQDDRSDGRTMLLVGGVVAVLAIALVAAGFLMTREKTGKLSSKKLVFSRRPEPASGLKTPQRPQTPAAQDSMALIRNDQRSLLGELADGQAAAPKTSAQISPEARAREKAFLAQHDGTLRRYQARLHEICQRYHKTHPIVREIDAEFSRMDRYMALKRRYKQDRDVYQWARDTMALPEVRAAIRKYMKRREAWSVAVDMSLETLRGPPPPVIYNETKRFMGSDPVMTESVDEMAEEVGNNADKMVFATVGKDVRPLQKLVSGVSR